MLSSDKVHELPGTRDPEFRYIMTAFIGLSVLAGSCSFLQLKQDSHAHGKLAEASAAHSSIQTPAPYQSRHATDEHVAARSGATATQSPHVPKHTPPEKAYRVVTLLPGGNPWKLSEDALRAAGYNDPSGAATEAVDNAVIELNNILDAHTVQPGDLKVPTLEQARHLAAAADEYVASHHAQPDSAGYSGAHRA